VTEGLAQSTFIAMLRGSSIGLSGGSVGLGSDRWTEFVTKKIELPAKWNQLVQRYKGLAPSYVKY
jgi:hypothetical protein